MLFKLATVSTILAASMASASITCLQPGQTATARWTNALGQTCTWTGLVGSNFGTNPVNGRNYSCNGRCGDGCDGFALGNYWTQDCFTHDICSWFYSSTNGPINDNCGEAFRAGADDTTLGGNCARANPVNPVQRPLAGPICR